MIVCEKCGNEKVVGFLIVEDRPPGSSQVTHHIYARCEKHIYHLAETDR